MSTITETTKAYIAGLFDGEGSVEISEIVKGKQHYLKCIIVNTHKPTIDWLVQVYGGKVYYRKPRKDNHRNCWTWQIISRNAGEFLVDIQPYTKIKYDQISIAFQFLDTLNERGYKLSEGIFEDRQQMKVELSLLKHKEYQEV